MAGRPPLLVRRMNGSKKTFAVAALVLSLGGLILAVSMDIIAGLLERDARTPAILGCLVFQLAGVVFGMLGRNETLGKIACITSAAIAAGSLVFMF